MFITSWQKSEKPVSFEPGNSISYKVACAFSEESDKPVDPRILSRTSTVRLKKLWMFGYRYRLQRNDSLPGVYGILYDITKTCLYNFDPLKPHFYIVKLGFAGVYIIFVIYAKNIDCGYSLEPPRRGGSNEYPQSMFRAEIWKIWEFLYLKIFSFWRWNFLYIWIGVFS